MFQALSNGWSNQLTQSQLDQMFRLTSSAQTKQVNFNTYFIFLYLRENFNSNEEII